MKPILVSLLKLSVIVPLISGDVVPANTRMPQSDAIRVAYVDFASHEYSPLRSSDIERSADCYFELMKGSDDAASLLAVLDAASIPTRFVDANVRIMINGVMDGPVYINSTGQIRWSVRVGSDRGLPTQELNHLRQQMDALARERKCGRYRPESDFVPF